MRPRKRTHRYASQARRKIVPQEKAAHKQQRKAKPEERLVRRVRKGMGFGPMLRAKELKATSPQEKGKVVVASIGELRAVGISYGLAPVINVDYNPDNPNIGKVRRAYSAEIREVE